MIINLFVSDFEFTDPTLRSTFTNPSTGVPYKEGDMYKREALANTLGVSYVQFAGAKY